MPDSNWYVYLIACRSGRIYTGVSPHLDRRLAAHRKGRGALFTRINEPLDVLAAKPFASERAARQVERQVKQMPAAGKRLLAQLWSQQHPVDERTQQLLALQ